MRYRKLLAGTASVALTAGLVAAGATAPATATEDPPPKVANPELQGCGIPVTLVLDASGSISGEGSPSEQDQVKAAANAFLDGLDNTNSSARVVQFATTSSEISARKGISSNTPPNPSLLAQLKSSIQTSYHTDASIGQTTNWESAMWRTEQAAPVGETPQLSNGLVVFVTDGDPNTVGTTTGSGATAQDATDAAQEFSDDLKTRGNRVIAVGVGLNNAGAQERLKQVSGDTVVNSIAPGDSINDFDVLIPDNFNNLTSALRQVAAALCGGSITLTKFAETAPETYAPAGGWDMTAKVEGATYNTDFTWAAPVGNTGQSASGTTADAPVDPGDPAEGTVAFQYNPKASWNTKDPLPDVVISETLKPGYTPRDGPYGFKCTFNGLEQRASEQGWMSVQNGKASFTIEDVPADLSMSCELYNRLDTGRLLLVKEVQGGANEPGDWTLTADSDLLPAKNYSEPGDNTEPVTVWAGVPYDLGETGPDNYSAGDWSCEAEQPKDRVQPAVPLEDDTVIVPSDTLVTCTIVNRRNLAELRLVKQVTDADANAWTLTAKAAAPEDDLNISTPGGSGQFESVYAGTEYTLGETGPTGYSASSWVCEDDDVLPQAVDGELVGDKLTLKKGARVTCTIVNTRDLGSLTITKEFNPQSSGFTGTFDINYSCVDGATPVKNGTVALSAGQSQTITGLPTGTVCTVTEPTLPANPTGWQFNAPTFSPGNQATVTTKDQTVSITVVNSVSQVSPVVVKKVCPIDATLVKPKPKKVGNTVLVKKIKTKKSSCVLLKPVVLCRPIASSAAGETAFCDTKVTKKGRIKVTTKGYDGVRVSVVVRTKPKPGFSDRWKPDTWRKTWILR